MTTVGELVAVLKADAKQFSGTMVAAEAQTKSFGGTMSSVSKAVSTAFIAVGAVAGAAILKGVSATQQWASDTRTLQRITGQTAESASGLLGAANLLGVSVSSLSTGFGALSKNIVNGSTSLTQYGIATKDAHGETLPFDDVLGNVIDKFGTLPKGAEQTAFAMNVFGRSGKDLIPILAKGREGMAELEKKAADLGVVMSQDDVDAAKELSSAQRTLGLAFKGASISIGTLFIPVLTKVVNFASRAVQVITKLPGPVKAIGLSFAVAAGAVGTIVIAFQKLTSVFGPVISGLTDVGKAILQSGLFSNASTIVSATATGISAVGDEAAKSGEQLALFGDSGSNALNDVQGAANATTIAVEASVAKQAGAFESLGTKFASMGSKLLGWGSTAATAIASMFSGVGEIALIVAAIAAAVAVASVVIVKNWDKVGTAFTSVGKVLAPFLESVQHAMGQVAEQAGRLGSALGDAFAALGAALAPLLPVLTPILSILGKALVLFVAAPFLAALTLLTITLKGVALGLQYATNIVEFFANAVIAGTNLVIKAINSVIGASNRFLHTNFQTIDSIDKVSISADAAATNVAAVAPAFDKAARSSSSLNKALASARPLLDLMQTSFKDLASGATDAFNKAQEAAGSTTESVTAAVQAFADQQVEAAQKASQAFKEQTQSALTFTTSMLSSLEQAAQAASETLSGDTSDLGANALAALRDQAHITATDILDTFRAAGAQTKTFGHDLLELSHIGGKAGKDLASALLTSGDVLSAQVIADAPAKIQKQIVQAFGKSESAADSFSTKLTNAIVGPLHTIEDLLVQLAKKAFHVTLNYNDGGATGKVASLHNDLERITGTNWNVFVGVHTGARSPWPDEALKQHLIDPMKRQGFKMINGKWTLPLDVGVHSSMSPGGAHGSLSPIHYGNDPSSIAEMLMKQAGWKNNFQNVLDRVNAAGQSPNYIDKVTQKLADKLGPAAAKAFRSALTDLDVQSGRIDPRWMEQAVKNVSYIPAGHTNISTNHHNRGRGGGTRVILDRRHYDEQTSYQEDYGRGF